MDTPSDATSSRPTPHMYLSNPFALIKPSWEAFKVCWVNFLLAIAISIGVVLAIVLLAALGIFAFKANPILGVIDILVCVVLMFAFIIYVSWAFTRVALAGAKGERMMLSEIWPTFQQGLSLLATNVLVGLAVLGGIILLIVPGIIFGIWFSQSSNVVVNEGLTGVAALKRSRELVRGRFWDVAGTSMLSSAISVVEVVPIAGPIVSFLASIVLFPLGAVRYIQLQELKALGDKAPKVKTSPWNALAIVLGLIGSGMSNAQDLKNINTTNMDSKTSAVEIRADRYYS